MVWLLLAAAEVLQGIVRVRLLNRRVGDHRARQIAVFTGSEIILAIAWFSAPVEMRKPSAPRRLIVWPPSYFFNAPKTCWSVAVVRATGFCLICRSSAATILNSPSIALFVT